MKKLFLGLLLAVIVMSANTSCKKKDVEKSPTLSELRNFTFCGVSNALNFKYEGKDSQGYDDWHFTFGNDFKDGEFDKLDITSCYIDYIPGTKNTAKIIYEIDFTYFNCRTGKYESTYADGDLDLTFKTFNEAIGFMDEYTGVESGIRDGIRVHNVSFTVANYTHTKNDSETE